MCNRLKIVKNIFRIFGRNANSIVSDRKLPVFRLPVRFNLNDRGVLPAKLDGIPDQILKYLLQLHEASHHFRKRIIKNDRSTFLDRRLQIAQRTGNRQAAIDRLLFPNPVGRSGKKASKS